MTHGLILLFDYDSLVYSAVSHIADTTDIREWFSEGRSKDWMREEVTNLVINRLSQMGGNIFLEIEETGIEISDIEYFLTNDTKSYRRAIYPLYKANRRKRVDYDLTDPKEAKKSLNAWKSKNFRKVVNRVRKRLIEMDFAKVSPIWEADDLIADRAREIGDGKCIIVSMDKDMKQVKGLFFDFYREDLITDGEPVLDNFGNQMKCYRGLNIITEKEAMKFFWGQMISGDSGDNIPGAKGFGESKVDGILDIDVNEYKATVRWVYIQSEYKRLKAYLNKRSNRYKKLTYDKFLAAIRVGDIIIDYPIILEDAQNNFDLNYELLSLGVRDIKK